MSGQHRKVSRSIDSSSGFVTSRSHLTQPENELKQKLNAIDSSIKISNKKINNETRELRQILYGLQRDLKVSKSVGHYVPSPIEEQETTQTKRVRRVTDATAPRDPQLLHRSEIIPKSSTEVKKTIQEFPGVTHGTSTKRRRKMSVPPIISGKILVKDGDVFGEKERELSATLSKPKPLGVEESGNETQRENNGEQETGVKSNCEEVQTNKSEHKTVGVSIHCDNDGIQIGDQIPSARDQGSSETSQVKPSSLSLDNQLDSSYIDVDKKMTNIPSTYKGIATILSREEWSSAQMISKGNSSGNVTSNLKYLKEGRRRSLSENETAYRETFKGKFMTHSLPPASDHVRDIIPPPDPEKRTRRITVAGAHPLGGRSRLDIGDIPRTPFHSGSRRISVNSMHEDGSRKSRSLGRGPTGGGQTVRRGSDEEETDKRLLSTPSRDIPRYRRTSKVSSLPPLKEERKIQNEGNQAAIEWKNLENCRYLRKDDYEISIEDIFKKD
ncbi:uncharacterized protein LOC116303399 [Actinia tenebrosa]|uniref:Uncharacterized protein LOC116303399 n=1 Tax=Actinia tenebrosa TaxID=6105 RepID=A0A6P8IPJ2_ACTTE|nr:uncharacterized protein LOC116303399 [Actinia tenebrosa]